MGFGRQGRGGHVEQNQQLTLSVPGDRGTTEGRQARAWRKCTAYRQTGLGGLPLSLRLSEGLGLARLEVGCCSCPQRFVGIAYGGKRIGDLSDRRSCLLRAVFERGARLVARSAVNDNVSIMEALR